MKRPIARPTAQPAETSQVVRAPRAFAATAVEMNDAQFDSLPDESLVAAPPRRMGWLGRFAWATGGALVSAGPGLAADRLIRDLFAANPWLGWLGLVVLAAFLVAALILTAREVLALRRLHALDALRREAARATHENDQQLARHLVERLMAIYGARADQARARQTVADHLPHLFDGHEIIAMTECSLMAPLDARAKT